MFRGLLLAIVAAHFIAAVLIEVGIFHVIFIQFHEELRADLGFVIFRC